MVSSADIICTTSKWNGRDLDIPMVVVFGLISGIGEEKIQKELGQLMHEVAESN
jgi:hypothetical protein